MTPLKRLGIEKPEVGMTIHLTQDYQLSGWFTDYTSEDRVLRSESGAREDLLGLLGLGKLPAGSVLV